MILLKFSLAKSSLLLQVKNKKETFEIMFLCYYISLVFSAWRGDVQNREEGEMAKKFREEGEILAKNREDGEILAKKNREE